VSLPSFRFVLPLGFIIRLQPASPVSLIPSDSGTHHIRIEPWTNHMLAVVDHMHV
jgi:hypothetical protein